MKFLYILPVIGVLFLFAQSNEAFGENTRIVSHDGIDGWKCTSGSLDSCPGGNKYPLSVSKTSGDGQPAPSLLISGDPQGGLACASKTIASDWYIQKVVLSFDVKSVTTSYFFPVTVIDGNLKNVSVPHFVWASGSHVIEKPIKNSDNDVTVQLCLKDKSTGCCDDTTTFYDNIKITTTEIDPVYVKALDDAERKAQQEKNDGKLEADAAKKAADDAEQLRKDADRKADEDERKADEDEARADAAQRSTKAIERSRDAAKEAMFYAEKALRLAEETREIAEKEEQYWEQVDNAQRLAREAEKKADEARERAEDAEEARSYKEKEQARDDAEAAAEAARDFADDVQRIAYDVQRTAIQVANAESPSDEPSLVPPEGGGCLIATAAFGSEMAPQVQFLSLIHI